MSGKTEAPIETWVDDIAFHLGGVRRKASEDDLWRAFVARDFTNMAGIIKQDMSLPMRLRIGYVRKGGDSRAVAWVTLPEPMPFLGSSAFKELQIDVCIRREFLAEAPFKSVVYALAHELAHVILDAVRHPLHRNEKVVDLTVMVLGYADILFDGTIFTPLTSWRQRSSLDNLFRGTGMLESLPSYHQQGVVALKTKLGYLSQDEAARALHRIVATRPR